MKRALMFIALCLVTCLHKHKLTIPIRFCLLNMYLRKLLQFFEDYLNTTI